MSRQIAIAATLAMSAAVPAAPARSAGQATTMRLGTPVALVTTRDLSSRTSAKGDMVELRTSADVVVDGAVAIPAGTPATGQVADSRGTGGMGTTGRLVVRPLYLRVGGRVVRLTGRTAIQGATKADTVVGMVLLTPLLSGRSARIPAGTAVDAMVERTVVLETAGATGPR